MLLLSMRKVWTFLSELGIDILFLEKDASDYEEAIKLCANFLQEQGFVKDSFLAACLAREKNFPTGLPLKLGVAIPHADNIHVIKSCLCLLKLQRPVKFNRIDDPKATVDVSFMVCIAIAKPNNHSLVLAQLITAFQDENFVTELSQSSSLEMFRIFKDRMAS